MKWFLKLRNESIEFVKTTDKDLRIHFLMIRDKPNVHQQYLWIFGHIDRAMRQIKKIKQHANYPK